MKDEPLIPEELEQLINDDNYVKMMNSFYKLTAENDEIVATIENLKRQNSAIKKSYADMLAETTKLLDSMAEFVSLTE